MAQKLIQVGSSAAVTIPKKSLEDLGLKVGDEVIVDIDKENKVVSIKPVREFGKRDRRIAKLTKNFIERYRRDLEALAQK